MGIFSKISDLPEEKTVASWWQASQNGAGVERGGQSRRDAPPLPAISTLAFDAAQASGWRYVSPLPVSAQTVVAQVPDLIAEVAPDVSMQDQHQDAPQIEYFALSRSADPNNTAFPTEISELEHNIDRAITNVDDLGDKAELAEKTIMVGRKALEQVVQLEKQADSFLSTVKSFRFTLKVTEKVGPLKVPSKFLDRVMERVEEVATHITFRAGQLREKIENGDYITKMESAEQFLDNAGKSLEVVESELKEYLQTIKLAQLVFENDAGAFDGLESTFDSALATAGVNNALDTLNTLYETLTGDFDALTGSFSLPSLPNVNVFEEIGDVSAEFGKINGSLDFLADPLKLVHGALKPIEWALDLVGFVFNVTVGPVINWILETLGLNDIMDSVGEKISALLPDVNVFDDVTAQIDTALGQVESLINDWKAQVDQIVADLRTELLEQFESASGFALRFGSELSETLSGRDGADILNPLDGGDTVDGAPGGGTGNAADLFVASRGKDVLYGGDSTQDWLLLPGLLSRFTFVKVSASAPLVIYDKGGVYGFEVAYGIEKFAFLDGFYDLAGLDQAGVLQTGGDAGDNLLIGSNENELFVHTYGKDSIDGSGELFTGQTPVPADGGTDTWLLEDDPTSNSNTVITLYSDSGYNDGAASPKVWEGRAFVGGSSNSDYLNSIEDVIIQDDRSVTVKGSAGANFIQANDSNDFLMGYGGDDLILGGAGNDLIIGGAGSDSIFGEADNDRIIGGPNTSGGDHYDGGAGLDWLIYSTNRNEYGIVSPTSSTVVQNDLQASGPLRIDAAAGTVQHLDADLTTVLATDSFVGFENVVGSDQQDTIRGTDNGADGLVIDGGGGADVLYSDGATGINGGQGDDTLYSTSDRGNFDGGTGHDILDLRNYDTVRWSLENLFGSGMDVRAVEEQDTELLVTDGGSPQSVVVPTTIFSGDADNIEVFYLGDGDDNLYDRGTGSYDVYAGDGNDRLVRQQANDGNHTHNFYGEGGDDYLELTDEDGNLYGGAGNDTLRAALYGQASDVEGNAGDDLIYLERFNNSYPVDLPIVRGGQGYDVVSFDLNNAGDITRIDVDLARYAMYSPAPFGSSRQGYFNALIFGVEGLIGSDLVSNRFEGTDAGEQFIGLSQNDTLTGRGGDDALYGGGGYDLLDGGDGDDLIHTGTSGSTQATSDTVDGGDGIDTLTFANARTEAQDGSVIVGDFGGVRVHLSDGVRSSTNSYGPDGEAHGAFGRASIWEIENVIGSMSADILIGNAADNVLAGADGDDTLIGEAGNDILGGGAGDNVLIGGAGDDMVLVSDGNADIVGGSGRDGLNFAGRGGAVSVDLAAGTWSAMLTTSVPVWSEGGGTEARFFNGTWLTPQDVLETDPVYANDAADLTRAIPGTDDYAADPNLPRFEISQADQDVAFGGRLSTVEDVTGAAGADGITGDGANNHLSGEAGNDTLIGGDGDDTLLGGAGNDRLVGGSGAAAPAPVDLVYLNEGGGLGTDGPDLLSAPSFVDMPTTALTFEAMVKLEDTSGTGVGSPVYTIMSYASGSVYNAFTLITTDTTNDDSQRYLRLIINNQVVDTTMPVAALYDGEQHRISVAWDGTTGFVGLYMDGVAMWEQDGIAAATTSLTSGGFLVFGQDQDSYGGGFSSLQDMQGGIGDIRIWDGVRSVAEIASEAHGPLSAPQSETSLASYWTVDAVNGNMDTVTGSRFLNTVGAVRFEAGTPVAVSGADRLQGDGGADTLIGGSDDDTLLGGDQNDRLEGGQGNDSVEGGNGRDTALLGGGDDLFRDNDQVQFGEDSVLGGNGKDTILGGGGNDSMDGQAGDDSVTGGDGNDAVLGGAGFDTLRGGGGTDTVTGGDGRDLAYLGSGNDLFSDNAQGGDLGRDTVYGNGGNDTINGGGGNDLFYGQDGNDSLAGRAGADKLFGGDGDDTMIGGDGNDTVAGGNGRDRAFLGNGNDRWFDNGQSGEFGRDFVQGGNGNDTISAAGGNDTIFGGSGADVFVFAASIDADVLSDYATGTDALQIDTTLWGGPLNQTRLNAISDTSSGMLVLDFGNGDSLTFETLTSNAGLLGDITLV